MGIYTSSHITKGKIIIRPNEGENVTEFINTLIANGYIYLKTLQARDLVFSKTIELADYSQYQMAITKELENLILGRYTELFVEYTDFSVKMIKK